MRHFRASGLKERRRLTVDIYTMKMKLSAHPQGFLLRVDQMVKELYDMENVILSSLSPQYDEGSRY